MKRTIRELREARSLSQQELAEKAGISPSYLCRLENFGKGARPEILVLLSNVLECRPEDILAAPPRRSGGQPKVAKEELSLLAVPPARIARPRWTSACRLASLRRQNPALMNSIAASLVGHEWFLEEVPSESADETLLQLLELHRGALPTWLSTAGIGYDLWPVCDEDGRATTPCCFRSRSWREAGAPEWTLSSSSASPSRPSSTSKSMGMGTSRPTTRSARALSGW